MHYLYPQKRLCMHVLGPWELHTCFREQKCTKHSSADCCRHSKVVMTRMRSSLQCHTYMQNAVFATYIYVNTDWRIFRIQKWYHACVSYTRMKSVLLRWTPSLNDCSKLKGECTDVQSGCGTSVGPSLNPHSLSYNKILVTLSL